MHDPIAHEDLARVTDGAERAAHVRAAREALLAIDLSAQAGSLGREFG